MVKGMANGYGEFFFWTLSNLRFYIRKQVAPMTTRRLGVAVAVLGGYLYAIGGSDGQCLG